MATERPSGPQDPVLTTNLHSKISCGTSLTFEAAVVCHSDLVAQRDHEHAPNRPPLGPCARPRRRDPPRRTRKHDEDTPMTLFEPTDTTPVVQHDHCPARGRASCSFRFRKRGENSASGGARLWGCDRGRIAAWGRRSDARRAAYAPPPARGRAPRPSSQRPLCQAPSKEASFEDAPFGYRTKRTPWTSPSGAL